MNPPQSFFFGTFSAASLAAYRLTRAESGEVMQSLTGSKKAVVTAAWHVPEKLCVKLEAGLQSSQLLRAAFVPCMFNRLLLGPAGKKEVM